MAMKTFQILVVGLHLANDIHLLLYKIWVKSEQQNYIYMMMNNPQNAL